RPSTCSRLRWQNSRCLRRPYSEERAGISSVSGSITSGAPWVSFCARVRAARADRALNARTDLLALLVRSTDQDGHGLSDHELTDELKTLLIAGHESTATAIAWAADLLAHNPAVAERLHQAAVGDRHRLHLVGAKEVLRVRT